MEKSLVPQIIFWLKIGKITDIIVKELRRLIFFEKAGPVTGMKENKVFDA